MPSPAKNLVFVVGDSIAAGSFCQIPYATRLAIKLGPTWAASIRAFPGNGTSNIAANVNGYQTRFGSSESAFTGNKVGVFEVGTNDVATLSGQAIYDLWTPQMDAGCNANWPLLIWQRNCPRGDDGSYSSTREGRLLALWELIKGYRPPAGSITKVVAFDTHPLLGSNLSGTNEPRLRTAPVNYKLSALDGTNDGLHPNDNAAEARASALYEVIQSVLGVNGAAAARSRMSDAQFRGRAATALCGRPQYETII